MKAPIYLDYAASAPLRKEALENMIPFMETWYGNASSQTHSFGRMNKAAVDKARQQVATSLNCIPEEISFTSGATEGINLVLKGLFDKYRNFGKHIISCKTEHKAVLNSLEHLKSLGAEVTLLDVDQNGAINIDELKSAITRDTFLLCFMWVNNETGHIHPIEKIAKIAEEHQLVFFSDATQAMGKVRIDLEKPTPHSLVISGHKFGGPKGVGAVYLKRKKPRVTIAPQIHGGQQEKGLRAGTLNTPAIVGLGTACELATKALESKQKEWKSFNQKIADKMKTLGMERNIPAESSATNIMSFRSSKIKNVDLIKHNPSFAFSLGSACTSDDLSPSHVLKAMGFSNEECDRSFRISIGHATKKEDVLRLIEKFQGE